MAATKKAMEVRKQKNQVIKMIIGVHQQIRGACGRIPQAVLDGDAIAASSWREFAEAQFAQSGRAIENGISVEANSLSRLNEIYGHTCAARNRIVTGKEAEMV